MVNFMKGIAHISGGVENIVLTFVALLFGTRTKFFYYCIAFTCDKCIISLFKMIYHHPRPFMESRAVHGFQCSREFGDPSGHSLSSALFSFLLILDFYCDKSMIHKDTTP